MKIVLLASVLSLIGPGAQAASRGRVAIVLTSHDTLGPTGRKTGYYLSEVVHPYSRLVGAGFDIEFISPLGGKAPVDENSRDLKDPLIRDFLNNPKTLHLIEHTLKPDEIDARNYIAIIYAGGHGTMWDFADHALLAQIAAQIYEQGGVVAAVCHGPAGLINVRLSDGNYLIRGKKLTAFTNAEETAVKLNTVVPFALETKLIERGAQFEGAPLWANHVVVDGRLVTGQNPASAAALGDAVVRLLEKR